MSKVIKWVEGPPPKDGKEYLAEHKNYVGPVMVVFTHFDGLSTYYDWDHDTYDEQGFSRWLDYEGT